MVRIQPVIRILVFRILEVRILVIRILEVMILVVSSHQITSGRVSMPGPGVRCGPISGDHHHHSRHSVCMLTDISFLSQFKTELSVLDYNRQHG